MSSSWEPITPVSPNARNHLNMAPSSTSILSSPVPSVLLIVIQCLEFGLNDGLCMSVETKFTRPVLMISGHDAVELADCARKAKQPLRLRLSASVSRVVNKP